MTRLTKELITSPPTHSSQSISDKHSRKELHNDGFKKLMRASNEQEEEKDVAESKSSDDNEDVSTSSLSAVSYPFQPMEMQPLVSETSTPQLSAIISPKELSELFEKMASTMLIMTTAEEQNTTLFLTGAKFSSSPFFGTRITIKEFSTAPKAYNVEIASHSSALALLSAHKEALLAAFEGGRFPFTIHRLETELHSTLEQSSTSQNDDDENKDSKQEDS